MKATLMTVLCGAAILALGSSAQQKSDSATLQGTWKGREIGAKEEGFCSLVVSGTRLEFRGTDTNEWYKANFSLREDANPKQLIALIVECPFPQYVGKTAKAIYRIEGATLTLTGNEPGNSEVPSAFDAVGARQFVLEGKQAR